MGLGFNASVLESRVIPSDDAQAALDLDAVERRHLK
jgi:hypothetical protein